MTDGIIDLHIKCYIAAIAEAGGQVTAEHKTAYLGALKALVHLARNEYALELAQNMQQVSAALR